TMAESMARAQGLDAVAVGNVGTPILDAIRYPDGFDVLIVELLVEGYFLGSAYLLKLRIPAHQMTRGILGAGLRSRGEALQERLLLRLGWRRNILYAGL